MAIFTYKYYIGRLKYEYSYLFIITINNNLGIYYIVMNKWEEISNNNTT